MPPRSRLSTATPAPSQPQEGRTPAPTSRPRDLTIPLPAYEAPLAPLSAKALTDLQNLLARPHPIRKIDEHLKIAASSLEESTGDINDRFMEQSAHVKKVRGQRRKEGTEDMDLDDKENQDLAALQKKVDAMTDRMETAIRKCVDGEAGLTSLEKTIQQLSRDAASASAAHLAFENTQSQAPSQSQRSGQQRRAGEEEEDEDGDNTMAETNRNRAPSVTQPGGTSRTDDQQTAPPIPSLTPLFSTILQTHNDAYASQSLTTRYAGHPNYINFKKITWDAHHPESEAPPLPNPSTWFAKEERGVSPMPGMTQHAQGANTDGNASEDGEDDDIAVARVKTSTKCPLTLREFDQPVTSRLCGHSFEQSAIFEMIDLVRPPTRAARVGRDVWMPSVECPVSGCNAVLKRSDLVSDKVLIRRIRRIQQAREVRDRGSDAVMLDGDDEDDDENDDELGESRVAEQVSTVKGEAQSGSEDEEVDSDDYDEIEED